MDPSYILDFNLVVRTTMMMMIVWNPCLIYNMEILVVDIFALFETNYYLKGNIELVLTHTSQTSTL